MAGAISGFEGVQEEERTCECPEEQHRALQVDQDSAKGLQEVCSEEEGAICETEPSHQATGRHWG